MYKMVMNEAEIEGNEYVAYGIIHNGGKCVREICVVKAEVEELIKLCNRLQLSPLHLEDVTEDFLEARSCIEN